MATIAALAGFALLTSRRRPNEPNNTETNRAEPATSEIATVPKDEFAQYAEWLRNTIHGDPEHIEAEIKWFLDYAAKNRGTAKLWMSISNWRSSLKELWFPVCNPGSMYDAVHPGLIFVNKVAGAFSKELEQHEGRLDKAEKGIDGLRGVHEEISVRVGRLSDGLTRLERTSRGTDRAVAKHITDHARRRV